MVGLAKQVPHPLSKPSPIQKLPIEKIIVGPHQHKDQRAEYLKLLINNLQLDDIEVTLSEIPYAG